MNQKCKIGIFIIAYNAESHIEKTLSRIPSTVWDQIAEAFVIDDCSTDETVGIAIGLKSRYPKLNVIRNPTNQRYGGNQKVGFQHAVDAGLDTVVMLHADGQYAPEILPEMISPLLRDEADVVLGSRMINKSDALKGGMPKYKFFGNIILTKIQNGLSGMNLKEFHTGYRAYSTSFLRSIPFWDNSNEWHFDTEILLQAEAKKARIYELPIPTYYGDEICHVNGMTYAFNCIQTTLRFAMHHRGLLYSRNFDLHASSSKYSSKFDDPYSSHSLLFDELQRIGLEGKTVLELGVGDASLTRRLHELGVAVDCIEIDPVAANEARPYARTMWNDSLEVSLLDQLPLQYDIVLAADILEHLVNPESILAKLKKRVKKDGVLLVSLPNIANIYVRLNLLLGRFPQHTKGILDSSHLHCYTRVSAERMLTKTGWSIIGRDYTSIPVAVVFPFLQKPAFRLVLHLLRVVTRLFKSLFSYQFLLYCRNPNQSDLL